MRISTNTIFDRSVSRMGELQTSVARAQQQVSTGKRILSPSDDPVAAARALDVTQSQEVNAKYAINRRSAKDSLWSTEGALQGVTSALQDIKTLTVSAGNGVLSDTERNYLATELQGRFDDLLGLANSRDGVGNYIFAGYQTATQPFTATSTGAAYAGDQGSRQMQVFTSRNIEVGQNGFALFDNISSSGTFVARAASANAGTGVISNTTVANAAVLTGHNYSIEFSGGGTTFSVYDLTLDPSKAAPLTPPSGTYTSGQAITFDGLSVSVTGAPQDNDAFTVAPTASQSIFTTIKDLIGVLKTPTTTGTDKANLARGLSVANGNIDSALDHVLTARAAVGSSLTEIDSLDSLGDDLSVQYAQTLSGLQDLDYAQGITDLMKQQNALQAAQQSFTKISGLSLFNYMS